MTPQMLLASLLMLVGAVLVWPTATTWRDHLYALCGCLLAIAGDVLLVADAAVPFALWPVHGCLLLMCTGAILGIFVTWWDGRR